MTTGRDAHLQAMDMHAYGHWLRTCGSEAQARINFRRACALEARYARSVGSGGWAAMSWCSAGWSAYQGRYMRAALRCVENGLKALGGVDGFEAAKLRELREAIAEARAGQVQR